MGVTRLQIELCRKGVTRTVLLIGRYAFKFPKMRYGWRLFLLGLLGNMQEVVFSKTRWPELCPIVFAIPGGWLVVMRRARILTPAEFAELDLEVWASGNGGSIPYEKKADSFGWLDGRIVVVDYGS